jgi:hypothetical protein
LHFIKPEKIITHSIYPGWDTKTGGRHSGSAAVIDGIIPGWSMYDSSPWRIDGGITLAKGRPWAAIEVGPEHISENFLRTVFEYRNNRYVNIFNWSQIKGKPAAIEGIKAVLQD